MAACGYHVGMTFQMVDDLLDLDGNADQVGKPIGIDLRDGNPSLPVVLAIPLDPEVARLFGRANLSAAEVAEARRRIKSSGVLSEARRLASEHGERARANLALLPPSEDRDYLLDLVRQLLTRAA
jgi:geranylgeranyl pyrophosphate synthase